METPQAQPAQALNVELPAVSPEILKDREEQLQVYIQRIASQMSDVYCNCPRCTVLREAIYAIQGKHNPPQRPTTMKPQQGFRLPAGVKLTAAAEAALKGAAAQSAQQPPTPSKNK